MIPIEELNAGDEIFEWTPGNGERCLFFDITMLRGYVSDNLGAVEFITTDITQCQAEFIIKNRGVEKRKLDRLVEPWLSAPILALSMKDGTTLIVDGHHRYVRKYLDGETTIRAILVPYEVGERFLVSVPEGISLLLR